MPDKWRSILVSIYKKNRDIQNCTNYGQIKFFFSNYAGDLRVISFKERETRVRQGQTDYKRNTTVQHTPTQGSPKGGPQHDQRKSLKPQDPSSDPTRNSWSFEALAMHHILNFSAIFLRRSGMHGWSFSPYVFLLASIEPPWSTLHTIGKE
jgi:hypothetical protein